MRGPGGLAQTPQVMVGTIHSVKGGQADVVYLFPDLSQAGDAQYARGGAARDSVIRQFYVGCDAGAGKALYLRARVGACRVSLIRTIGHILMSDENGNRPSNRMSVDEIARRLDIGRLAVYAMLEQGILPGIRLGRRWIVTRHAYEEWERTCGTRSNPGLQNEPEVRVH